MGRRRGGYGRSPEDFWGALRGVWSSPARYFGDLDPSGGPIRPAIFASLILYLNLLLEAALQALWLVEFNYALVYAPLLGLVASVVLAPLLLAGLTILVLVILEGAPSRRNFIPVFRSLAYASAIGIVLWIPYAPLLAIPYFAYAATVAIREALGIAWNRAAAATLIPLAATLLVLLALTDPGEITSFLVNPPGS